jgi:hypothetical protein
MGFETILSMFKLFFEKEGIHVVVFGLTAQRKLENCHMTLNFEGTFNADKPSCCTCIIPNHQLALPDSLAELCWSLLYYLKTLVRYEPLTIPN